MDKQTKFFYQSQEEKDARRQKVMDWLSEPGNNFCTLPYAHMAVESNGAIRPCCMGKPLDLNIKGLTIQEAFNHPVRKEFIESFERNEQHPNCNVCWKDKVNRFNTRLKFSTNDEIIEYTESIMLGEEAKAGLKWLEIKPGNRCNLKCRICGVHNSSQWTKDYFAMTEYMNSDHVDYVPKKFKDSAEYKYTQSCEWIDSEEFWNYISGLDELNLLHFMGGEPFMVPEHFTMLRKLVDDPNVNTKKIKLRYNTNGTYWPTEEQFEIWEKFRRVQLLLSVDDVGKRFEYQRKLANWDEVRENLINYRKLAENSWREDEGIRKYSAFLDPTVNVYNIWNLGEIAEEFEKLGYEMDANQNHFVTGGWNDCRILPQNIKDAINERHKDCDNPWVATSLEYMNTPQITHDFHSITLFYKTMMYQDHLRGERFVDLWPEYYHLMTPHIDWSKINQHGNFKETKYEQKNI